MEYTKEIRDIYIALARAVESGDSLKIGITLGQALERLKTLSQ